MDHRRIRPGTLSASSSPAASHRIHSHSPINIRLLLLLLLQRPPRPDEEDEEQHRKDEHGQQLEDDATRDDVRAGRGVAARVEGVARHGGARGLHDEGDDVAGAKDGDVELGLEDGEVCAAGADEVAQHDVESGCDEDGSDD